MQADRFEPAAAAFEKALAVSTRVARDAGVWVELAEAKGLAQGGRLSGAPVELIGRALAINATHPRALDLAGSAAWEARDFAGAARHWLVLLDQIPAGDSRRVELQAAIDAARERARFSLPSRP
jgi:cytochrome c-type biogenesis protein CcmH